MMNSEQACPHVDTAAEDLNPVRLIDSPNLWPRHHCATKGQVGVLGQTVSLLIFDIISNGSQHLQTRVVTVVDVLEGHIWLRNL